MGCTAVQAALGVVLLFTAAAKAAEGGATFWREEVTLTCPEKGTWYGKERDSSLTGSEGKENYVFKYAGKARFRCEYPLEDNGEKKKYFFYVEGKACKNCIELDARLFWLVVFVDMLGTAIVMMIIYKCNKKKSPSGPPRTTKQPGRSGGHAPPVPSPDYESLNPNTRSSDVYSVANRMG
ncbi:T-cell surface glycoprotein CD3 epsilon chain-like isoform 2-T2 [Pholidichthys leucotaenia]